MITINADPDWCQVKQEQFFPGKASWTTGVNIEQARRASAGCTAQHSSYNYQLFDILRGVAPHHCQGGDEVRDRESLDVGMVGGSQCGPFSQSLLAGGKIEDEVNIRDQYI